LETLDKSLMKNDVSIKLNEFSINDKNRPNRWQWGQPAVSVVFYFENTALLLQLSLSHFLWLLSLIAAVRTEEWLQVWMCLFTLPYLCYDTFNPF